MEDSFINYINNNVHEQEGNSLVDNHLSNVDTNKNRKVVITKKLTSALVNSALDPPSPPPDTRTIYECIQIQITSGLDLNFTTTTRP